jgi:tetratricopeptide (TPR) repeat protein
MIVKRAFFIVSFSFLGLTSCSYFNENFADVEVGEKTQIGAAAGGLIGAGLGAVVGNQTGNPASGMLIGALAGSGTGALIGAAFDSQEEALLEQKQLTERQGRLISAQQSEIAELRKLSHDTVSFSNSSSSLASQNLTAISQLPGTRSNLTAHESRAAFKSQASVPERMVVVPEPQFSAPQFSAPQFDAPEVRPQIPLGPVAASAAASQAPEMSGGFSTATQEQPAFSEADSFQDRFADRHSTLVRSQSSAECQRAEEEASKAALAPEIADKLFHYRRALRLCPDSPYYHNGLGEVYLALNRYEDAEFEFREALKLDPSFKPALENIERAKSRR